MLIDTKTVVDKLGSASADAIVLIAAIGLQQSLADLQIIARKEALGQRPPSINEAEKRPE
jgi:hypothetical protein